MRTYSFLLCTVFWCLVAKAQTPKTLTADRTNLAIKIDGIPDDAAWKATRPATGFVEMRPNFGAIENDASRTEVYILYDNVSIYIAGYCHERSKDSISKELVGRDVVGVNDFVGVIFDTYHDKINATGFYVTPLGEQYDAKYSNTSGEDESWNGVWQSESKIVADGWTFEMRIPFSMLRFVSKENQTWGLNITRRRQKTGQQFMWNPVDPKVNGFINQEGEWKGIQKIESPIRLSFSPYLSSYINHYPTDAPEQKNWTSSINGGMDVKYGINDAFTLDMTLIPDFGQVRSDNQVLNLTPFEVRYQENRPFFTEGTELFNKGNLFYSRRVGGAPIRSWQAGNNLGADEYVLRNPAQSKLLNATKISGRTRKGLGLGFFNALAQPMYATIQNRVTKEERRVETSTLTNYNIVVADQTLKNNSAVSFINLSTIRKGNDPDANVSAALFDFNNKKNTYNWNGKFTVSQIFENGRNTKGYSHNLGFGKTGGRLNFQIGQELADKNYDINDMGILFNNNFIDHYFWMGYRWLKPTSWYNRAQVNFNASHSQLFSRMQDQKIASVFQGFRTNVNANMQLKNLWTIGMFVGLVSKGNDFYEPRTAGHSFRTPRRLQFNPWFETNRAKKYFINLDYFLGLRSLFNSPNHTISFSHRYRFNDRLSISQDVFWNPVINDAGFYHPTDANGNSMSLGNIVFTRRDLNTVENVISAKYNFNNKSGITFRARHYWSKVEQKELYDLQSDGNLTPSRHAAIVPLKHRNFSIFNIDAVYTWQFAPGSFINIVWKDEGSRFINEVQEGYFKNFDNTLKAPQNNNLSFKIIYFLDYLDFKKWRRKNKSVN